jgi:hypothetical protein
LGVRTQIREVKTSANGHKINLTFNLLSSKKLSLKVIAKTIIDINLSG